MSKYDSPRDEVLHQLATSGTWGQDSGDVQAPTGWFAEIDLDTSDFAALRIEFPQLLEDSGLGLTDADMAPLTGFFIVQEHHDGRVDVTAYGTSAELLSAYRALDVDYIHWLTLPVGSV